MSYLPSLVIRIHLVILCHSCDSFEIDTRAGHPLLPYVTPNSVTMTSVLGLSSAPVQSHPCLKTRKPPPPPGKAVEEISFTINCVPLPHSLLVLLEECLVSRTTIFLPVYTRISNRKEGGFDGRSDKGRTFSADDNLPVTVGGQSIT